MSEKLQEHFQKAKEFPVLLRWRIIIMLKQSGQWLNEIAETFSDYAKFLRLLRFFDCMKTQATVFSLSGGNR